MLIPGGQPYAGNMGADPVFGFGGQPYARNMGVGPMLGRCEGGRGPMGDDPGVCQREERCGLLLRVAGGFSVDKCT